MKKRIDPIATHYLHILQELEQREADFPAMWPDSVAEPPDLADQETSRLAGIGDQLSRWPKTAARVMFVVAGCLADTPLARSLPLK